MINPADIMKIMGARKQFQETHPKVVAFLSHAANDGIEVGSVLELKITRPDGSEVTTNMRVQQSDMNLVAQLKEMAMNQK